MPPGYSLNPCKIINVVLPIFFWKHPFFHFLFIFIAFLLKSTIYFSLFANHCNKSKSKQTFWNKFINIPQNNDTQFHNDTVSSKFKIYTFKKFWFSVLTYFISFFIHILLHQYPSKVTKYFVQYHIFTNLLPTACGCKLPPNTKHTYHKLFHSVPLIFYTC
jgi:hypothetical protein